MNNCVHVQEEVFTSLGRSLMNTSFHMKRLICLNKVFNPILSMLNYWLSILPNVQQFYPEGGGMPPRVQFVFKNVKISSMDFQNSKHNL